MPTLVKAMNELSNWAIRPRQHSADSSNVRTHFYLAVAYREVDSLNQAASAFEETITRIADDVLVDAYVQSAVTYNEQGLLHRAIDAYKTALRVQPTRPDIYFHLATLYDDYYRDKTAAALYYRKFFSHGGFAADTLSHVRGQPLADAPSRPPLSARQNELTSTS